ncbi:MAG: F0F1 ATP synthase subunit alpha, partial [Gammaproteobacteria bacterium]|nr:F0F1 ATP synthase subunit alpha [Gammaproteobacteria bacterium]
DAIRAALDGRDASPRLRETGIVSHSGAAVVRVEGLSGLMAEERVRFEDGSSGIVIDLDARSAGVVLLGRSAELVAGTRVQSTGELFTTPVGDALLGRVVDATGAPLDHRGPLRDVTHVPVERDAPAIMDRAPVSEPMQTGIKLIDALIPIGRGQRELILGDRQTGKTSIALDTLLNQRATHTVCVYCAIGQRGSAVAHVIDTLRRHHALDYSVVMVASGEDTPGLQYVTPYAAMALAEHFMTRGRDVLIIYDDLTRHARAYRELSLLLRRPPGREAYPGDVFYLHARLLERATRLRAELGGGSITALPIVETQAQDIAAYIPTNLISITDGQIYTSPDLFHKGLLPAIDVGKSVSRVGGKTQLPAYRTVSGPLRLAYAQFEELETFARFATRLDEDTRARIERGRRVRELLRQNERSMLGPAAQISVLHALNNGLFDRLALERVSDAKQRLLEELPHLQAQTWALIDRGERLDDARWRGLLEACRSVLDDGFEDGHSGSDEPTRWTEAGV